MEDVTNNQLANLHLGTHGFQCGTKVEDVVRGEQGSCHQQCFIWQQGLEGSIKAHNVSQLRRHVTGSVEADCKPGPSTALTEGEEDRLARHLLQMSEMGFGLSRDTVMHLAYQIVHKAQRNHPFKHGKAGRAWMDGFLRHLLDWPFVLLTLYHTVA